MKHHIFQSYLDEHSPISVELSDEAKELERKRIGKSSNGFIVSIKSFNKVLPDIKYDVVILNKL